MSNFQVPVSLYMSKPVTSISHHASLEAAFETMMEGGVSSLPALDADGLLVGIITRTDLLRVGRRESGRRAEAANLALPEAAVSDEMTPDVYTVSPDAFLEHAANEMVKRRIHRVVVSEDGRPLGVLSTRDVMRAIEEKQMNDPVSEFMSSPVFTIRAEEPLAMAVERLEKARVSGLVVVEEDWPVGIFTQTEALEARDVRRSTPVGDVMNTRLLTLSSRTRIFRAAAQAASTGVRRVVVQDGTRLVGILSGLDFARAVR
ncbi:MAG: CBS domain-containing protein [Gemmatimonadales bacterium]|nr:MAG: CBS domain-containing protein [Gemmatimonadales bacterium]